MVNCQPAVITVQILTDVSLLDYERNAHSVKVLSSLIKQQIICFHWVTVSMFLQFLLQSARQCVNPFSHLILTDRQKTIYTDSQYCILHCEENSTGI